MVFSVFFVVLSLRVVDDFDLEETNYDTARYNDRYVGLSARRRSSTR